MGKNKKSQISIFVIIAVIIIVAGLLIFLLKPDLIIRNSTEENVDAYIQKCMEDSAKEVMINISEQGGYVNPGNYILYDNSKVGYTCYNINYYSSCVMQTPQITGFISKEIKDYTNPKLEACYNQVKANMEKKGYDVEMGQMNFNVRLAPNRVELDSKRDLTISKDDEHYAYTGFKASIVDPIYDFSQIVLEISNQEAKFCNFEYLGYMLLYPRWSIDKDNVNGDSKIYTIKEKSTGKQFRFAIRSCAFPAGM